MPLSVFHLINFGFGAKLVSLTVIWLKMSDVLVTEDFPIIRTISDLVNAQEIAAKKLNDSGFELWWRGQSCLSWEFLPAAYRDRKTFVEEQASYRRFIPLASTRYPSIPNDTDYPGWLFLMQHYGLRTRLLDWSESLLIGAYFAVQDLNNHMNDDGVLAALNPKVLNGHFIGTPRVVDPKSSEAAELFNEPFELKDTCELPPVHERKIVGVFPNRFDMRMAMQQSVFTIHGSPKPLEVVDNSSQFLLRFKIPSNCKKDIRDGLFKLGIRRSGLFPDLENLAAEIKIIQYR